MPTPISGEFEKILLVNGLQTGPALQRSIQTLQLLDENFKPWRFEDVPEFKPQANQIEQ